MQDYKQSFIEFCLQYDVIRFGEFTLKSGRVSPYFFNAGLFQTGRALAKLGEYYAQAIIDSGVEFDVLFGPAYKGIPLVSAIAIALADKCQCDKPYCFNRKVAKDHGEGGHLVGAPLQGRVLITDDVITAGTAIRHSMDIIKDSGAELAGVVVSMDRQERGQGEASAIQEVEKEFAAPVVSIVSLSDIMQYLELKGGADETLDAVKAYWRLYGC